MRLVSTPPCGRLVSTPPCGRLVSTPPCGRLVSTPPCGRLVSTPPCGRLVSTPPCGRLVGTLRPFRARFRLYGRGPTLPHKSTGAEERWVAEPAETARDDWPKARRSRSVLCSTGF